MNNSENTDHDVVPAVLLTKALRALEVQDTFRILVMEMDAFIPSGLLRDYVDLICNVNEIAVLLASRQSEGSIIVAGVHENLAVAEFSTIDWVEYTSNILQGSTLAWSKTKTSLPVDDRVLGQGCLNIDLDVALSSARAYAMRVLENIRFNGLDGGIRLVD